MPQCTRHELRYPADCRPNDYVAAADLHLLRLVIR
jgi:hypothetical protein